MKKIIIFFLMILMVSSGIIRETSAQSVSDCSQWRDESALPLLTAYEQASQGSGDLVNIVELQTLRRTFDTGDLPPGVAEAKAQLVRMIDVKTDALVAALSGDVSLAADLAAVADETYQDVVDLLNHICPANIDAEITSPKDGDEVGEAGIVEGSVDENQLGTYRLLVVLVSPGGTYYYPQIVNACEPEQRITVNLGPAPNEWSVPVGYGGTGDFKVVLYLASPEEIGAIYDLLDDWCRDIYFPGITSQSVRDLGLEYLMDVSVIRRQ